MTIEQYIGDEMSKEKEFEAEEREPFKVPEEEQKLYQSIIKGVFKPKWHKDTHRKHNKAHTAALKTLQEKVEEFEKSAGYIDEVKEREALAHALIKYRKEAGIPVSEKEEDFHRAYAEVDMYLDSMKDQHGNKLRVDEVIKAGNIEDLLHRIHKTELARTVASKVKYQLHNKVKPGKEAKHYQNLFKAYANETGQDIDESDIAKIGRDELIDALMQHYESKMGKVMEKYTAHKAKDYHAKHPEAAQKKAA